MSLQAGRMPPRLSADQPPALFQLGHPHTVYILPASSTARAGRLWGAWRVGREGAPPETVPLELLREPPGYIVALRLAREDWHGDIELAGDILSSVPGNEAVDEPRGPLAQPIRFQAQPDLHPLIVALQFAPTAPLSVALVPAGGEARVDGSQARVEVTGLPIEFVEEAPIVEGTVRFLRLPSVDRALRLRVDASGPPLSIGTELWRSSPTVYVLDAPESSLRARRVTLSDAVDVAQAVARTRGGQAFGLVAIDLEGTSATLHLPPETVEVFLDAREAWAHLDAAALAAPAPRAAFEKGFTYQGSVSGEALGATVRLFRQAGEEAYSGQGFEIPLIQESVFEGHFPLGRYWVEVVSPRGVQRRERPLVVDKPQQFHVRLDAP